MLKLWNISEGLAKNQRLTTLDLSDNGWSSANHENMKYLAEGLAKNHGLTDLKFSIRDHVDDLEKRFSPKIKFH